jgi:ethanolamine utilization cobalamin adenosyltransferase
MMKTSLSGDIMVPKSDGRIRFRGLIDSLEAEVIEAQILASSQGEQYYCDCLGEVLDCLRSILAAEVKESPFQLPALFGLSADELHRQTHDVTKAFGLAGHPLPSRTQGPLAARLNTLRAHTREAELHAVRLFCPTADASAADAAAADAAGKRENLPQALNRLSSALYWLFCRLVSE